MLSKVINEVSSNRIKDGVHNMLKQMFSTAFNNRLIETNPAANLPRPKQSVKNEKKSFTTEQEKRFVDLCLTDLEKFEPFIICLLQGLRKGEMLALRPNDFDFERNLLRIDESYDERHPDDLQTKNQTSNRTMPMFNLTRRILLKYANADPNERIYANYSYFAMWNNLVDLLKTNNLPKLTMHELRHTFISRCHEKGIDEIIVQKWVGHAIGSRMTKAVYTHVADDVERKYIELLNQNAS
jgi:integrase